MGKQALNCNDTSSHRPTHPRQHTHMHTDAYTHIYTIARMKYVQHTDARTNTLTHTHTYTPTRPCLARQSPYITSLSHLPCNWKIMPLKRYETFPSNVLVFLHLWWLPTFHQWQADSARRKVSLGTTAISPHVSVLGGPNATSPQGLLPWGREWAGPQVSRTRKETKNTLSSLPPTPRPPPHELRLANISSGGLHETLFNDEKYNTQAREEPVLWDCHCVYSPYLFLLVNSPRIKPEVLTLLLRPLGTAPRHLSVCTHSTLSSCLFHSIFLASWSSNALMLLPQDLYTCCASPWNTLPWGYPHGSPPHFL